MSQTTDWFDATDGPEAFASAYLSHVRGVLAAVDRASVAAAIELLDATRTAAGRVWVIGNGGSAAAASHFANDLVAVVGSPPFTAFSLTDNPAVLTAIANDHGYADVFARQLHGRCRAGDLVVAISASGNSGNVLRAVDVAHACGAHVLALSGFDGGGALAAAADAAVIVPSRAGEYGPVEGTFSVLLHVIANYLALKAAPTEPGDA